MDTDGYFWITTEPKYTHKRPKAERVKLMKNQHSDQEKI